VGTQQGLDDLFAVLKELAQLSSMSISRLDDVAERDRRSGQLLTDGSTQETILVKHADFGHVSGIVTDDDRLANVCCQGRIEVTPAEKPDTIAAHFARFGHGQQQEIELLERGRHLG